jgi:hypothetical protein
VTDPIEAAATIGPSLRRLDLALIHPYPRVDLDSGLKVFLRQLPRLRQLSIRFDLGDKTAPLDAVIDEKHPWPALEHLGLHGFQSTGAFFLDLLGSHGPTTTYLAFGEFELLQTLGLGCFRRSKG